MPRSIFCATLDPPIPIRAFRFPLSPVVAVEFDKPLREGLLDPANWTGRVNNTAWNVLVPPIANGKFVAMTTNPVGPNAGADVVRYKAEPPDVVSAGGFVPAAAWPVFPIT